MARDASGNYSLPLPSVVSGDTIEASWANTTLSDMKNEFSDSLSRSGKGGMTSPLKNMDGTALAPSITFNSEAGSGMYRAAAGDVRVSVLGADKFRFNANGAQVYNNALWKPVLYGDAGTVNDNTLRWDSGSGLWDENANWTVSAAGDANGTSLTLTGALAATGTVTGSNLSGSNTGDEVAATDAVAGIVELATQAEVNAGTDTNRVVTPATLAGFASFPVATKGDLYTFDTAPAAQPVGTNGQVLTADSTEPTGLKWITIATGGLGSVVEDTTPELGGTLVGNNYSIQLTNTGVAQVVSFYEPSAGGSSFVSLQAPALTGNVVLKLPTSVGALGQVMNTDGGGQLGWENRHPLTTKGDIMAFSTSDGRFPVGSNAQILTVDSTQTFGLRWDTPTWISNVSEDSSPTLGNTLDTGGFNIDFSAGSELRLYQTAGTFYAALKAPTLGTSYTLTLPTTNGNPGEVLSTDGTGALSWVGAGSGTVTSVSGGTGLTGAVTTSGSIDVQYASAGNVIDAATLFSTTLSTADHILFLDATDNTVKKATVSRLPFTNNTGDITAVNAGNGLSGGGTTGSVTLSADIGTSSGQVAAGNHLHTGVYATEGHTHSQYATLTGATFTGQVNAPSFSATSARDAKDVTGYLNLIKIRELLGLTPIRYVLKGETQEQVGLFADEVDEILPEAVSRDETGKATGIDYSRLIMPLLMMIRDMEVRMGEHGI